MQLSSTQNPLLQEIRRAISHGRTTEDGCLVIEGPHLVEELFRSKWRVEKILTTPSGRERYGHLLGGEVIEVQARAFASLSGTENSQEIMALARAPQHSWLEYWKGEGPVVVLDGIQDPGNAGTIVRSAEAFGAAGVIFAEGCVHVANGKFLRATAGSLFRLPYLENIKRTAIASELRARHVKLFALAAEADATLTQTNLRGRCALIVGSEAQGVSPELRAAAQALRIATVKVESLNAAVACSLALFEAARQRGTL